MHLEGLHDRVSQAYNIRIPADKKEKKKRGASRKSQKRSDSVSSKIRSLTPKVTRHPPPQPIIIEPPAEVIDEQKEQEQLRL